jgi:hypothetical protein
MVQILMYEFDVDDFLSSLKQWETLVRQYEGARENPGRRADNNRHKQDREGPLQGHLMLNPSRYGNYDDMRQERMGTL